MLQASPIAARLRPSSLAPARPSAAQRDAVLLRSRVHTARLRRFVTTGIPVCAAISAGLVGLWLAFGRWDSLVLAAFMAAFSGLLVLAVRELRRDRALPAVTLMGAGVLSFALLCSYLTGPMVMPVLVLLILWPVLIALPYISGPMLVRRMAASTITAVACSLLALRPDPFGLAATQPSWLGPVINLTLVPAYIGFSCWLLWHYSKGLRDTVSELHESRQMVTAAEERLRRDIAHMLHARVQSRLLQVWQRLGHYLVRWEPASDEARDELANLRQQIDDIREYEVRRASHMLHPSIIRTGLAPALRALADEFEPSFKVELAISPELRQLDDPRTEGLPQPLRLLAYRVVEEALGNVQRHAGAQHVRISAAAGVGVLALAVEDDGRGFDPAAGRWGLGLSSIDFRVRDVGGAWTVSSDPGRGTVVSAELPLPVAPS